MIKLKRRQVEVESELKEMQGRRYSELSMQLSDGFTHCFFFLSVYLTTLCRIMEGRKDKRMAFRATIEQAQLVSQIPF